jgi:hypothetical protein
MPSTSGKQHRFMEAIAHNKAFAKKVGVPQSVGQDFAKADKGKTFKQGGDTMMNAGMMAMMAKKKDGMHKMPDGKMMKDSAMKKGGMAKSDMKEDMKMDKTQDKAMIKKAFKQHDMQEHKGGKGTNLKLKKGGKMATGGVTDGQGGYKTGGVVLGNGGGYKDGGMPMKDGKPAFIGDGKGMKKGGMATGGVKMGNAGGFKHGGKSSKKAYATGGTVDSGKPVAMPQGAKKPTPPVSTNRVSGTFKKGGTVKMNGGGASSNKGIDMSKGAYDASSKHSRELEDAMNPLSMVKELAGKAKDYFMPKTADSVTKTKESVTVTPASKKRGGVAC